VEFREYLGVLRKYWVSIVLLTILGCIGAGVYIWYTPPVYTSSSTVLLSVTGGNSASDLLQGTNYATAVSRSLAQVATMPYVLEPVIRDLKLEMSSGALASKISATIPTNTQLIIITVRDGDKVRCKDIAGSVAANLVKSVESLYPADANGRQLVQAKIVAPPYIPNNPTSPQPVRALALGFVAGLAVGVGVALLRKALDVRLHVAKDVTDAIDYPVVASIPRDPGLPRDPVVMVSASISPMCERYRQLRTNLRFFDIESDSPWNFAVTSSIEGEGKTVTAINVAYALAESGDRVLLIDADLRRPKVASYLQLEGGAGLTTVLLNRASFTDVVQSLGMGAPDVLTSGGIPPNPAELIGSRRMKQLLEQVSREYRAVVIDAAPLLPVADTLSLLPNVSGTLMIAAADKVTIPQLKTAVESAERSGGQIMGIVLNRVRRRGGENSYYTYYYQADSSKGSSNHTNSRRTPKRAQEVT